MREKERERNRESVYVCEREHIFCFWAKTKTALICSPALEHGLPAAKVREDLVGRFCILSSHMSS